MKPSRNKSHFIALSLMVGMSSLLSACNSNATVIKCTNKISSTAGTWSCSYGAFSDTKTVHDKENEGISVKAGQKININYSAEVQEGSLTLELGDGSTVVWQKELMANEENSAEVAIEKDGLLKMRAAGKGTKGKFTVEWAQ